MLRWFKQLKFYFTRERNFCEVSPFIIPGKTRVSAMPWWSARYSGLVTEMEFIEAPDIYDWDADGKTVKRLVLNFEGGDPSMPPVMGISPHKTYEVGQ